MFPSRDFARALAPELPMELSKYTGFQLDKNHSQLQAILPQNCNIHGIFNSVRVVFPFRDSARACAPLKPMEFSKYRISIR